VLYAALALLLLLHNDVWLWDDASLMLGLPVGMTYHVGYSVAAFVLFLLLVKFAWPRHLEAADDDEERS
jgi:hypothetical protein